MANQKSISRKAAFTLALLIATTLPTLSFSDNFSVSTQDTTLDHMPYIDYHPTIVLGDSVVITNQQAYATPILFYPSPNDLDSPLGIYVNGVEARVIQSEHGLSDTAYDFGFAEIAIEGNGLDSGFSGFIPKEYLVSTGAETPSLPIVAFNAQGTEDIALLLDFAEDAPIVATYPNGTQAQLLGYLDDMCHVQIGVQSGFVKTSQLELPQEVAQGLAKAMPRHFESFTAHEKYIGFIHMAYLYERSAQYGEYGYWPLWLNAEYSALCMQLGGGTGFMYGVNIMPGPDDLPEQEARRIAVEAICERLGITQETLSQYESGVFFYDSDNDTGHYWHFAFWGVRDSDLPMQITISVSSPAGEAVELRWIGPWEDISHEDWMNILQSL